MNKLDRIFEGYDMDGLFFINLVQDRGQSGRFTATGCTGHKNEAGFFLGDFLEDRRQLQACDRRDLAFQFPQNDREMTLLAEDVDAETSLIAERITAVA